MQQLKILLFWDTQLCHHKATFGEAALLGFLLYVRLEVCVAILLCPSLAPCFTHFIHGHSSFKRSLSGLHGFKDCWNEDVGIFSTSSVWSRGQTRPAYFRKLENVPHWKDRLNDREHCQKKIPGCSIVPLYVKSCRPDREHAVIHCFELRKYGEGCTAPWLC